MSVFRVTLLELRNNFKQAGRARRAITQAGGPGAAGDRSNPSRRARRGGPPEGAADRARTEASEPGLPGGAGGGRRAAGGGRRAGDCSGQELKQAWRV
jgi:hypothetical protein